MAGYQALVMWSTWAAWTSAVGVIRWPRKAHGNSRRHVPGVMNRTETRYSEYLANRLLIGEIQWWEFEPITFKLGKDLRWTPDFLILTRELELEFHDTKAGTSQKKKDDLGVKVSTGKYVPRVEDDARVKIIMAAEKWPFLQFCTVWEAGKAGCGTWDRKDY